MEEVPFQTFFISEPGAIHWDGAWYIGASQEIAERKKLGICMHGKCVTRQFAWADSLLNNASLVTVRLNPCWWAVAHSFGWQPRTASGLEPEELLSPFSKRGPEVLWQEDHLGFLIILDVSSALTAVLLFAQCVINATICLWFSEWKEAISLGSWEGSPGNDRKTDTT